jgi:hypothetical protein
MMGTDELGEGHGQGTEGAGECSAERRGVCWAEAGDGIKQSLVGAGTKEGSESRGRALVASVRGRARTRAGGAHHRTRKR